ncbi:MAG: hypothetical protein ACO3FE_17185 [Planctomycetaceae bacterium]
MVIRREALLRTGWETQPVVGTAADKNLRHRSIRRAYAVGDVTPAAICRR